MSLSEKIKKEIERELAKKEIVETKWKFPWFKKVGKGQRKKNFVTTLLLNENGTYDFKKYQITEQTIIHDLIPRLATAGHVMFDKKGNPLIILPNWSVEPFSPLVHYDKSMIDGSNRKGYQILMAKMLSEQIKPKTQMGSLLKWILGLGLVAVVAYAFIAGA